MIKLLQDKKLEFYLLLAILLIGAFLRFYSFPYRYSLGEETIRDAIIGIEGAREFQFPLTGPFSSLGPFTFGPWYAYQLIIFNSIFPSLYSSWIYLSLISVIYICVLYKIGKILGGGIFGLSLALLSAVSPAQIISATHLTSHNNTNLFAALAIWVFLKIIIKNISYWWGFALGLLIGIGMNLHFQMGGLLILPLILLFYKGKRYLYFISSSLGVVTSFLPLLFFELNNHWFTVRNIMDYLLHGKNATYVPNRWLFYIRDFWPSFWADALGAPVWITWFIIFLFIAIFAWGFYKGKIRREILLLFLAFFINFVFLRYYWGPKFFGYLNYLRPFIFIFTTFTIVNLINFKRHRIFSYAGYLLLAAIVFFSIPRTLSELSSDGFTMRMYSLTSGIEKQFPNKKFALYTCSKKYTSSYNAETFSLLFLLELRSKFDAKNGIKIGLQRDCLYKNIDKKIYASRIMGNEIVNFDNLPNPLLAKNGWDPLSFSSIYNSYARWWFRLQP